MDFMTFMGKKVKKMEVSHGFLWIFFPLNHKINNWIDVKNILQNHAIDQ